MTGHKLAVRVALYALLSAVTFLVCFPLVWALFSTLR